MSEASGSEKTIGRRAFLLGGVVAAGTILGKNIADHFGFFAYKAAEVGIKSELPVDIFVDAAFSQISKAAIMHFEERYDTSLEANPDLRPMVSIIDEAIKLSGIKVSYKTDPEKETTDYYWQKLTEPINPPADDPTFAKYKDPGIEKMFAETTANDVYQFATAADRMDTNEDGTSKYQVRHLVKELHQRGQSVWSNNGKLKGDEWDKKRTVEALASAPILNWGMVGAVEGSGYARRAGNEKELSAYTHKLIDAARDEQGVGHASRMLAAAILENNGRLDLALWDTTTALKLMARNDLDTAQHIADKQPEVIMERFKGFKDELSVLGRDFMNTGYPDNTEDKDMSVVNKVGILYHAFNSVALLSCYPRPIIKMGVIGSQLYELQGQGLVKTASDFEVLRQLKLLEKYLSKFS